MTKDSLKEIDGAAIAAAIRILSESGFRVNQVGKGNPADHGVEFRLDVHAPTRVPSFATRMEAAKDAVMDLPEIGMDGTILEADDG